MAVLPVLLLGDNLRGEAVARREDGAAAPSCEQRVRHVRDAHRIVRRDELPQLGAQPRLEVGEERGAAGEHDVRVEQLAQVGEAGVGRLDDALGDARLLDVDVRRVEEHLRHRDPLAADREDLLVVRLPLLLPRRAAVGRGSARRRRRGGLGLVRVADEAREVLHVVGHHVLAAQQVLLPLEPSERQLVQEVEGYVAQPLFDVVD
mmetsp:Transcript_15623/g.39193  ORF Transcript_15623/g.39193 Transcript_15623/m.39193 type:complete len:205 (-) Transcript_15623:648-1262(-)